MLVGVLVCVSSVLEDYLRFAVVFGALLPLLVFYCCLFCVRDRFLLGCHFGFLRVARRLLGVLAFPFGRHRDERLVGLRGLSRRE